MYKVSTKTDNYNHLKLIVTFESVSKEDPLGHFHIKTVYTVNKVEK